MSSSSSTTVAAATAVTVAATAATITTTTTYNNQLNVGPPSVDCDDDENDDNAGDSNGNDNGKGDLPYNKIITVAGTGPNLRSGPVWSVPPNNRGGKENRGEVSGQKNEGHVMITIKITTNWSEEGHSENV